ncbi:MAG: DNA methyltransferase [Proteobacteria bacterium]|nr:DNA methyltransferase [Pseudomonadota bacterium]
MVAKTKVIIGDSRRMEELQDESIHLVITSPPYWQLKDYGNGSQIGFNDSYEDYINNLDLVWNECYRILHKGCRLCVNIGDQFARSVYYGRYKIIPIREEIIKFCETIGFDYMGAIIWQKVTTCNTTGGASIMGSFPYPRNGIIKLDYEFILIFKKLGNSPRVSREIKEKSRLTTEEWNEYFYGHWNFPGEKQDKHLAMFPVELPKRLIKMFSFVGDTILDPFLGSGTTCFAAKNLQRHSVGYEINGEFLPTIKERLGNSDIIFQQQRDINYKDQFLRLPYIFKDPVRFDKKIDPRKLVFGSKISASSNHQREIYHMVKEIINPEMVILDNDLKVRLLGIKTKESVYSKAMEFLSCSLKGQRIFMKYDEVKYDEKDNLLCYLYLKNKTFLNAHLIKEGLAKVDRSLSFKYKSKFLALERKEGETNED